MFQRKYISYFLNKLASASLLIGSIAIYLLIVSGFNLYDFSKTITGWYIVLAIYSILSSIFIDFIKRKRPGMGIKLEVYLYALFGFIPFIYGLQLPFIIIAGTVGVICALLYMAFNRFFMRCYPIIKLAFILVIPILLLVGYHVDFTTKTNWQESSDNSSFSASFDYFNGEHAIPIKVKDGQSISFIIQFISNNGGGNGIHATNEDNEVIGMKEIPEKNQVFIQPNSENINNYQVAVKATSDGVYHLVVTGQELSGKVTVNWQIE